LRGSLISFLLRFGSLWCLVCLSWRLSDLNIVNVVLLRGNLDVYTISFCDFQCFSSSFNHFFNFFKCTDNLRKLYFFSKLLLPCCRITHLATLHLGEFILAIFNNHLISIKPWSYIYIFLLEDFLSEQKIVKLLERKWKLTLKWFTLDCVFG
jgi:hypothetical protein